MMATQSCKSDAFVKGTDYPDLQVILANEAGLLIQEFPQKIFELTEGVGSPLHCIFPQQFARNIASFKSVLQRHRQQAIIFFAKKSNKSQHLVDICRLENIGLDVASPAEFELALAGGVRGAQLSVSGPEKSDKLLLLAINHGAQIAVDSVEEFLKIQKLASTPYSAETPKILIRYQPNSESGSRFGLTSEQLSCVLCELEHCKNYINLLGFSFHLSGYAIDARAKVAMELIAWVEKARTMGFANCNQINIGGGFPLQYVNEKEWLEFTQTMKPKHFHRSHSFPEGFYPYGKPNGGSASLDSLLSFIVRKNESLASLLLKNKIQLALEPGRALLDQAGLSIFRVQAIKKIDGQSSYHIATVEGMSFSLSEQWFGSEYLPSPFLIKANRDTAAEIADSAFSFPTAIAGHSCLECDMLSWRKIPFQSPPQINDLLVYPNTAGYQMDSNESAFHSIALLPKAAVWFEEKHLHWQLDFSYRK